MEGSSAVVVGWGDKESLCLSGLAGSVRRGDREVAGGREPLHDLLGSVCGIREVSAAAAGIVLGAFAAGFSEVCGSRRCERGHWRAGAGDLPGGFRAVEAIWGR